MTTSPQSTVDLLDHPDPHTAAQAAAVENLLRCWVRETDLPAPADGVLRVPLPASGTALLVPVLYWSPTGMHRFGLPAPGGRARADPAGGRRHGRGPAGPRGARDAEARRAAPGRRRRRRRRPGRARRRLRRRTAVFIAERRNGPPTRPDLFLAAEQSLVLGHPLHPTPKSREGLSDGEARLTRPSRAAPSRCTGSPSTAPCSPRTPPGPSAAAPSPPPRSTAPTRRARAAAARGLRRAAAAPLAAARGAAPARGRGRCSTPDCSTTSGAHGPPGTPPPPCAPSTAPAPPRCSNCRWACASPTPVGRTSARNSTAASRCTGCCAAASAAQWQAAHPGFDIVRDPAWLAVDGPDGLPLPVST